MMVSFRKLVDFVERHREWNLEQAKDHHEIATQLQDMLTVLQKSGAEIHAATVNAPAMASPTKNDILTAAEAAREYKFAETTVQSWCRSYPELDATKNRVSWRISRAKLEAFLLRTGYLPEPAHRDQTGRAS